METEPFTLSNQRCLWQMCGQRADLRILRAGAQYCREHSLFMWSIVDEELRESRMTLEQVKAKDAENKAKEQHKIAVREQAKETAEEKRNRPGYVYYLRIGELFKIGFASNLEQRLASYPPGTQLLAVEDGSLKLETQRHREFAHSRAAGREWYKPNPALDHHIQTVAENRRHTWWDDSEWQRKPKVEKPKIKPRYWK